MSLYKYFKWPLPTNEEVGLGYMITREANESMQEVLKSISELKAKQLRKE